MSCCVELSTLLPIQFIIFSDTDECMNVVHKLAAYFTAVV